MSSQTANPEVVVVTGASAGIGRATVREFARRGAHVGLIARGKARLEAARLEVEAMGGRAVAVSCDVADHDSVEDAAARIEESLGPIDIWVNNAFAGIFSPFMEMTPAEYRRVTEVTYFGQVWGTMAALRRMRPRGEGAIVLVGSALAYRGIPLQSAYCGAKHAIQGFQDSVRSELLHEESRINVSMVQLPAVNTPQFDWVRTRLAGKPRPAGTVYQPEVAAEAIWFAAHSRRKEIVVAPPAYKAIVGDKLASGLLDRYLGKTGFGSQQEDEPVEPGRVDNLFEPVSAAYAAHGRFDAEAHSRDPLRSFSRHRALVAASLFGLAAAAAVLARSRTGSSRLAAVR